MKNSVPNFGNAQSVECWIRTCKNKHVSAILVRNALRLINSAFADINNISKTLNYVRDWDEEDFAELFRCASALWVSHHFIELDNYTRAYYWSRYASRQIKSIRSKYSGSLESIVSLQISEICDTMVKVSAKDTQYVLDFSQVTLMHRIPYARHLRKASSIDAKQILDASIRDHVIHLPLWPNGASEDWKNDWLNLKRKIMALTESGFSVWIDWYEARIRGSAPDWERAYAYVLDLEDFWSSGPASANAEIARRLEYIDSQRSKEAQETEGRVIDDAALGEIVYDALRSEFRIQPRTTEVPRLPAEQDAADYGHKLEALSVTAAALAEDVARDFPDAGRGFSAQLNRFAALLAGATPERLNPDLFFEFGQGVLDLHADPDIHDALPEVFAKRFDRLVAVLLEFGEAFYADVQARRAKIDELRPPNEGDAGPIATEAAETPARLVAEVPDLPPLNEDDRRWLEALAEEVRDRGVEMLRLDDARREAERTALFRLARRIVATVAKYVEKAEDRVSEMPEGVRHSLYASAAYEALKKLIQTLF